MAEGLKRGDIVLVALQGDYGKPRPAVIIQDLDFSPAKSVIVCPFTSSMVLAGPVRPLVRATLENRLQSSSQIMVDKLVAVSERRLGPRIGSLAAEDMLAVEQALVRLLGLLHVT